MNAKNFFGGRATVWAGGALLALVAGCTTYVETPRPPVYVAQPPPPVIVQEPVVVAPPPQPVEVQMPVQAVVEIRTEQDFYEPLSPYGHWVMVAEYGRCWVPDRVERDWQPYTSGHWQHTEAGWYWVSDEPWGWATYHYGRWDWRPEFGWVWVPQTQWAPAWVSFHQGGGYLGWAPLHPTERIHGDHVEISARPDRDRGLVCVEERHFLEPVRPTTVVVNNTTIINQTVNITSIKVVNNTIINEGPHVAVVEKASGRKVETVPVREVRHKQEAAVAVAAPHLVPPAHQNTAPLPNRPATPPRDHPVPTQVQPNDFQARAAAQAQQKAREDELNAAKAQDQRRNAAVQAQAQQAKEAALQAEAQRRAHAAAATAQAQAQAEAQRKAKEAELKAAQAEAQHRATVNAQAEAQRKAKEVEAHTVPAQPDHRVAPPTPRPVVESPKPAAPHVQEPVTARIAAAFAAEPALRGVHVVNANGVVQLTGTVSSAAEKKHAGDVAQKIETGHPVQNNLTVR